MGRIRKVIVTPGPEMIQQINSDLAGGIKPTGSPALDALLEPGFPQKTNKQALEIALQVQKLLRGDLALLSQVAKGNQEAQEAIRRLNERMDAYDKAEKSYETDHQGFIDETIRRSEGLRLTGDRKARLIAAESQHFHALVDEAKATTAVNKLSFDQLVDAMPKVKILWPFKMEIINGQMTQVPILVRVRHRTWVYQPGEEVEVPSLVAERIREVLEMSQELSERQRALKGDLTDTQLAQRWASISEKYKSGKGDSFHTADGAY